MSTVKKQERTQVGVTIQLIFIVISISIIGYALMWRTSNTFIKESPPKILPVSPDKYEFLGGFASVVVTGLSINRFQVFDLVKNEFTFEGIVWFSYTPGTISIDTLKEFTFQGGEILSKSSPKMKIKDDKVFVSFDIRASFRSNLDYQDFPVDDHGIFLVLTNTKVSPGQIIFESSYNKFKVNAEVFEHGWQLNDKEVEYGYVESIVESPQGTEYITSSAVMFEMDYVRNSIRYTLSIILPLALLLYIGLFSISLSPRAGISLGAATATAVLAYRFVIENLSPKSGLFMISDRIFFIFLTALILVFLLNIIETKVRVPVNLKRIFVAVVQSGVAGAIFYTFIG